MNQIIGRVLLSQSTLLHSSSFSRPRNRLFFLGRLIRLTGAAHSSRGGVSAREMKTVSLFSGIGGLDLGLEDAGHEIVMQVESDPYCCQVSPSRHERLLEKNVKASAPRLTRPRIARADSAASLSRIALRRDIADVTELPADTELLAAGFPCPVRPRSEKIITREKPRRPPLTVCSYDIAPVPGREHVQQRPPRPEERQQDRACARTSSASSAADACRGSFSKTCRADVAHERRPPQPPAVSYVVAELESLGYRWAQRVVGLTGFGLPQQASRVHLSVDARRPEGRAWRRRRCVWGSASSCSRRTRGEVATHRAVTHRS